MQIKQIVINSHKYDICDDGNIFSYLKLHNWKHEKRIKLKGSKNLSTGYISINLGNTRFKYVHRIIAQIFIPNPDNKPCINHKDGNKENNSITNLEWCTYSENHLHAYKNLKRKTNLGKDLGGGLCFDKSRNKWIVYIDFCKVRKYLGRYNTEEYARKILRKYKKILKGKNGIEDLKKAREYLDRLIKIEENK